MQKFVMLFFIVLVVLSVAVSTSNVFADNDKKLQDSGACEKAGKENTLEGWQKYLVKYPKGQCAEKAKEFVANVCLPDQVNIDGHCCKEGQDWSVSSNRCIDAVPVTAPTDGWALIESGSFQMGSPDNEDGHYKDEGPVHKVTISRSFLLKKTEVTQGEWRSLMGKNPSYFSDCGADCPVERVSWWDSLAYCNALSKSEGLEECYELSDCKGAVGGGCDDGDLNCYGDYQCSSVNFKGLGCKGYRLPTEAEWEYATRAGSRGKYYADNLDDIAWYDDDKSHPVGQKSPNKWGLYDVSGNVWEWTWDWYDSDYYSSSPKVDPLGAKTGHYRVYRGGSWSDFARNCRLANRCYGAPGFRYLVVGLRPARSLDP